jgi:DNA-binding NarL/FixJ family response regulator
MSTSILLVEDNYHKRQKVMDYINSYFNSPIIKEAHSFSSGSKAALEDNYELVILDISLPTYDKIGNEAGGRKRMFGGREIARKLIRRRAGQHVVFLTQYDAFSDGGLSLSFDELGAILKEECGNSYLGLIHYDSSKSAWKEQLSAVFKIISEKQA